LVEYLASQAPDDRLLDVVDAVLDLLGPLTLPKPKDGKRPPAMLAIALSMGESHVQARRQHVHQLRELLDDARLVFRVSDDGRALVRRSSLAATRAYRQAVAAASAAGDTGSADQHLTAAWSAVYGLHTDPVRAYSEAIKAVEAAAHAVVQPNHSKATLGTMIGELNNAAHKFTLASAPGDITVVILMMRALWDGQTSRHGGKAPTRTETTEEGRSGRRPRRRPRALVRQGSDRPFTVTRYDRDPIRGCHHGVGWFSIWSRKVSAASGRPGPRDRLARGPGRRGRSRPAWGVALQAQHCQELGL
jgi:hypothetical protein